MQLKADNTSLYEFFLMLIIFIIILSFAAVTLILLSSLVDSRIEVSSLQKNWLQIKDLKSSQILVTMFIKIS